MRFDEGLPLYDPSCERREIIAGRLKRDGAALAALDTLGEGTPPTIDRGNWWSGPASKNAYGSPRCS